MKLSSLTQKLKNLPLVQDPRLRQKALLGGCGLVSLVIFFCITGVMESAPPTKAKSESQEVETVTFEGAGTKAPREEVWVKRMEGQAESMQNKNKDLQTKLDLMDKKMDVLEKLLTKAEAGEVFEKEDASSKKEVHEMDPFDEGTSSLTPPTSFPSQPSDEMQPTAPVGHTRLGYTGIGRMGENGESGPGFKRIGVIRRKEGRVDAPLVEGTIPGGSRVGGMMLSGLAVSTSTQSQEDPHPVIIRLHDDFLMPRGFSAPLKDAVVIGQCHGDRSSERAFCTLETLSYVEASGEIVEEKIQGWVFGEDGRYGLQGQIVDRSDVLLRDSFLAGLASGMANFFQSTTTSSVFPVSPFGQTNAMKPSDMLQAGGASGVGQALDRLAKFYIDSAEKMSPVLLVNPGRKVDIVLRTKLDFAKSAYRKARVRLAKGPRLTFANEHAIQTQETIVRKDLQ